MGVLILPNFSSLASCAERRSHSEDRLIGATSCPAFPECKVAGNGVGILGYHAAALNWKVGSEAKAI